jgi:hypothetical protein
MRFFGSLNVEETAEVLKVSRGKGRLDAGHFTAS